MFLSDSCTVNFQENNIRNIVSRIYYIDRFSDIKDTFTYIQGGEFCLLLSGKPTTITFKSGGEKESLEYTQINYNIFTRFDRACEFNLDGKLEKLLIIVIKGSYFKYLFGTSISKLPVNKFMNLSTIDSRFSWEMIRLVSEEQTRDRLVGKVLNLIGEVIPNSRKRLQNIYDDIYFHQGMIKIEDLIKKYQISYSTIERDFKIHLGISPKEFIRKIRFIHYLNEAIQNRQQVFDLVSKFGYYDQSHLIKDCSFYLGITPEKIKRSNSNFIYFL
jgi:AraC-like DNA-binding protein